VTWGILEGIGMSSLKTALAKFFQAEWSSEGFLSQANAEILFERGGIKYSLWALEDKEPQVFLRADPSNPSIAFPAFEMRFSCHEVRETEAMNVGPVLLFYGKDAQSKEVIRMTVTQLPNGSLSWCPILQPGD
jgi:hypothetical protein